MTVLTESRPENSQPLSKRAKKVESASIAMLGDGFYSTVSLGPKAVIDLSLIHI